MNVLIAAATVAVALAATGATTEISYMLLIAVTLIGIGLMLEPNVTAQPADAAVLDLIAGGTFSHGDTEVFRPLVDNLRYDDPFLVLADYASYIECQDRVSAAWQDTSAWTRMSILNTARSGKFSSDRAIEEYCDDIWNVLPVTVKV